MDLLQIFKEKQIFSFEIFPPKTTSPIETIYETLDALSGLSPDFISVTYGAAGSGARAAAVEIAGSIRNKYAIESVAHLTCIGSTKEEILTAVHKLRAQGIRNILALRGDRNQEVPQGEFEHADELIFFLAKQGGFHLIGACYPETHPESESVESDLTYLRRKVDAGATHLISQLFFDNADFLRFLNLCRKKGITVPIEAGIMPVTSASSIRRMVALCGAKIPGKLAKTIARYEGDETDMLKAGIDYATAQIRQLLEYGVDGIHLYTMNKPLVAKRISDAAGRNGIR